jgi:hypothetical protein
MIGILSKKKNTIIFVLSLALSVSCRKEDEIANARQTTKSFSQTPNLIAAPLLSQTRTAGYLNSLNNFRQVYGDQNYPKAKASDVATDDGIYAYTSRLSGISDTSARYHNNSISTLALQGFGFTIPDNATIVDISVKLTRFKKGNVPIGDYFLTLMQSFSGGHTNGIDVYGYMWRNGDVYPGNLYPDTETEYIFSQSGSGNNGWYTHDEAYQWTPAIINLPYFGLRIDSYPPVGHGSDVVYYDLVEITVDYSLPA